MTNDKVSLTLAWYVVFLAVPRSCTALLSMPLRTITTVFGPRPTRPQDRHVQAILACMVVVSLTACRAPLSPPLETETVRPEPALSLCIGQPEGQDHLRVEMDVFLGRLQHDGRPLELVLPGGEGSPRSSIRNLEVRASPDGPSPRLGFTQEGRFLVHTGGRDHVRLRYTAHPVAERLSPQTRHAMIGRVQRLYAPGHTLLVQIPNLRLPQEAILEWRTGASCDTLPVSSSIEAGPTSLQRLMDAHFIAGAGWWRSAVQTTVGTLTVHAEADAVRIARQVLTDLPPILRAQELLTQPAPDSGVHVVLLSTPAGSPPTGAGRAGGFVLEIPAAFDPLDPLLMELLAHENLHRVLGHTLYFPAEAHESTLWFVEGITEFLALQELARLDPSREVRLLSTLAQAADGVERYTLAHPPGWDAWNRARQEEGLALRLPYDQGLLAGAWLMSQPSPVPLDWATLLRDLAALPQPLEEGLFLDILRTWAGLDEAGIARLNVWITPGELPDFEALWARLGLRRVRDTSPHHTTRRPTTALRLADETPTLSPLAPTASLRAAAEQTPRRDIPTGDASRLEPLPASPWRHRLALQPHDANTSPGPP